MQTVFSQKVAPPLSDCKALRTSGFKMTSSVTRFKETLKAHWVSVLAKEKKMSFIEPGDSGIK